MVPIIGRHPDILPSIARTWHKSRSVGMAPWYKHSSILLAFQSPPSLHFSSPNRYSNAYHSGPSTDSSPTSGRGLPCLLSPSEFPSWSYEPRDFFRYELIHQSTKPGSSARVGRIHTPHGIIDTPGYVPVATNAALKGVDFRALDGDDTPSSPSTPSHNRQLVFSNTYHLLLQPGTELIRDAGGIHKFTGRQPRHDSTDTPHTNCGPFITDSGGFQVFSMAYGSVQESLQSQGELKRASPKKKSPHHAGHDPTVKVTEEGVVFSSYRDGSKILLTPESTVLAQKDIGADIIVPLDELPPYHVDRTVLQKSVERSHRWEARSLRQHLVDVRQQAMYCVVHGGIDRELRTRSVEYLTSLPFDGYAIGGSLGNGRDELKDLLEWLMPLFETEERKEKPRHLLGIADEESIRNAVVRGVDTLDSCYPTRLGRHGTLLVKGGSLRIRSGRYKRDFGVPIEEGSRSRVSRFYDRAYLHHLFKANEPLGSMLATEHNLCYMQDLMAEIRRDILENKI